MGCLGVPVRSLGKRGPGTGVGAAVGAHSLARQPRPASPSMVLALLWVSWFAGRSDTHRTFLRVFSPQGPCHLPASPGPDGFLRACFVHLAVQCQQPTCLPGSHTLVVKTAGQLWSRQLPAPCGPARQMPPPSLRAGGAGSTGGVTSLHFQWLLSLQMQTTAPLPGGPESPLSIHRCCVRVGAEQEVGRGGSLLSV